VPVHCTACRHAAIHAPSGCPGGADRGKGAKEATRRRLLASLPHPPLSHGALLECQATRQLLALRPAVLGPPRPALCCEKMPAVPVSAPAVHARSGQAPHNRAVALIDVGERAAFQLAQAHVRAIAYGQCPGRTRAHGEQQQQTHHGLLCNREPRSQIPDLCAAWRGAGGIRA